MFFHKIKYYIYIRDAVSRISFGKTSGVDATVFYAKNEIRKPDFEMTSNGESNGRWVSDEVFASKQQPFTQCWINDGPVSATLANTGAQKSGEHRMTVLWIVDTNNIIETQQTQMVADIIYQHWVNGSCLQARYLNVLHCHSSIFVISPEFDKFIKLKDIGVCNL